MDIKCKKNLCVNNKCQACMASGILIGNALECKTFEKGAKKEINMQDVSKNMFEIAPEMVPFRHNRTIEIDCKANCLFNNDGRCCANGITLIEGSKSGICATNIKK